MCPVVIGHGNGRDSFHDQERRGSRFELRLDLANINLYSTTDYNDTSQHKCSPVWSSCLAGHNIMRHAAFGKKSNVVWLMIKKLILLIVKKIWHSKHFLRFTGTRLPQHTLLIRSARWDKMWLLWLLYNKEYDINLQWILIVGM